MFTCIVVPLDGSGVAALALPVVQALAMRVAARVCLLTVIPAHDLATPREPNSQQRASEYLRLMATRLHDHGIETAIAVREGDVAERIVQHAADMQANTICMATHDRVGVNRLIAGSIAEQVLRLSAVPVFLVRPEITVRVDDAAAPVVVPLDGSARAETALPHALALAQLFGAPLLLVRVDDVNLIPPDPEALTIDPYETYAREYATQTEVDGYLSDLARRVRRDYANTETAALSGAPAEQLTQFAREVSARFIVIGSRARSLLGSTAARLLHASVAPLLIVTPSSSTSQSTEPDQPVTKAHTSGKN